MQILFTLQIPPLIISSSFFFFLSVVIKLSGKQLTKLTFHINATQSASGSLGCGGVYRFTHRRQTFFLAGAPFTTKRNKSLSFICLLTSRGTSGGAFCTLVKFALLLHKRDN